MGKGPSLVPAWCGSAIRIGPVEHQPSLASDFQWHPIHQQHAVCRINTDEWEAVLSAVAIDTVRGGMQEVLVFCKHVVSIQSERHNEKG